MVEGTVVLLTRHGGDVASVELAVLVTPVHLLIKIRSYLKQLGKISIMLI